MLCLSRLASNPKEEGAGLVADDLDDASTRIQAHVGFENDPHGWVIMRIFRYLLALRTVVANLKQRIEVLESRLPPP